VKIAIRASFAVNVFLVFLKIFIAVRSNSMSVLASALDSILDIVSGSIMFVVDWLTRQYVILTSARHSKFLTDAIISSRLL
jgi:divalent metal cation (Fe/Co/Zn/Cd) transporter